MNLLSVGAAYGAITLVFQKGVGSASFNAIGFNFQQIEAIEAWLPLFLFSVLFGLSMDYHVFLLSRIREEYDKTHDNTEAVAYGLRTTAGIITGAAIIMVTVFIGFAAGRLGPFQQMGFGLAVAVFLDATIVRTLLVPASMRLLGRPELVPAEVAAVAAEAQRRRPRAGAGRWCRTHRPSWSRPASPGRGRASSDRRDVSPGAGSGSSRSRAPGGRRGRSIERRRLGMSRIRSASSIAAEWSARFRFPICRSAHDTPFLTSLRSSVRRTADQRQVAEELAVGRILRPHGPSSDHREGAALHEGFRSSSPALIASGVGRCAAEEVRRRIAEVPRGDVEHPSLPLGARSRPRGRPRAWRGCALRGTRSPTARGRVHGRRHTSSRPPGCRACSHRAPARRRSRHAPSPVSGKDPLVRGARRSPRGRPCARTLRRSRR